MFKLSLLPKVKRILRFLLQANDEIRPLNETLRKTPTTLCKSPWRVYGLLIIFSASSFPVIIYKFQLATCKTYLPKVLCIIYNCNVGVLYFADWLNNNVISFNAGDEESEETPKTVRYGVVSYFYYLPVLCAHVFVPCKVSSWQQHKRSLINFN